MSVSKKLRFEIFKRDLFTCQYCGKTPPAVVLEIDHILPQSKEGNNDERNLATACFDCNRGKSDGLITAALPTTEARSAALAEKQEQLKQYHELLRKQNRIEQRQVKRITAIFEEAFPGKILTANFELAIRKNFLSALPLLEVCEAMQIACARGLPAERTTKYFCGIAWNKIRRGSDA